jgi:L-asparaginase type I
MTRRILVLYTGGTIGMDDTPQGLAPMPGLLPRQIEGLGDQRFAVEVLEYAPLIDSSAVTPAHWNRIIEDIAARCDDFDGFIVVHGTDTMAYTASVLAFALQGLGKPVVLTGSQLPLVRARSDGWNNLADALEAAAHPDLREVVIVFDRVMLRGCRARKVNAEGFHGFDSPNAPVLAEFGIAPRWYPERWLTPAGPFSVRRIDEQLAIAAFFLTPGAGAGLIGQTLHSAALSGAVLMSYGNGNTPEDAGLLDGVREASARGVIVLNITQSLVGAVEPGAYAASQPLVLAGALPGRDLTPEAAIAKLYWLLSAPGDARARQALLAVDLIGESRAGPGC